MTFADLIDLSNRLTGFTWRDRITVRLPIGEWDEFKKLVMSVEMEEANFTSCRFHGIWVEVEL